MSLIRWICSRLLNQVIQCPLVIGGIYMITTYARRRHPRRPQPCPQAVAIAPCGLATPARGFARGWPPLQGAWPWPATPFLAAFAAKMHRTVLRELIFITQFKTNLSHENLGSDTTVEKPQ
ncbi:hypothetical protein BHE74_00044853 [Ensete ventricosum]|nr:hypothetical protein GW17_00043935 [Ensete ventricosum]RWW49031.1 hypothetical protein BHE74_00044853 [Ensete ventricosum]